MPLVRFYKQPVKNEAKSKEAGRPVFDEVVFVEKKNPGERDTVIYQVRKMQPPVEVQFPEAWAAYQRDESTGGLTGTHLRSWPLLDVGEIETLIHSGVKTVEQLAEITDANISQFPGGMEMRAKAINYIRAAKESAPVQALAAEVAEKEERIAYLEEQLAALAKGQGLALPAPKRRKKAPQAEG